MKHENIIKEEFKKNADDEKLQQFIADLNGDLQREYSAAIQYIQHASTIDGPQWPSIEELNEHADEEIEHAKILSDRIDYLGGVPTVEVFPMPKISDDAQEMLMQDLVSEKDAIQRYRQRIMQAKQLNDFGTEKILKEILTDEEEHENDLLTFLGLDKSGADEVKKASV